MMPSSSQPSFRDSSPPAGAGTLAPRPLSQFTYRNLSQMASYNTSCPLRVVAHVDLDCFYAQAEMVRLGVSEDQPLAVQQWCVICPAPRCRLGPHHTRGALTRLCAKAGTDRGQLSSAGLRYRPHVHSVRGKETVSQHHLPARSYLA
jgi:DNA polymerase eta